MGVCNHLMKSTQPRLAFDSSMSKDAVPQWQATVRTRLRELMGVPDPADQPEPVRLFSKDREGYRLEKWEAYPEPGSVVPYLVLVPDAAQAASPHPAVMCFPGSAASKELLAGEPDLRPEEPVNRHAKHNQMALHYVRAGLVAVVVENPGTVELDEIAIDSKHINSGRDKLCGELMMLGRNYVGLSVFQKQVILKWLRGQDYVDSDRIALSGHSLGTEPAMALAVLDPGICALVFNDFLCRNRERYATRSRDEGVWRHTNPLWHVIPGLLAWFDFPDLLASLAPRPLLITEGGANHDLEHIARAYELVGSPECYEYHYYAKYARPEDRKHDFETIPSGVTQDEYFEYVNVDVPNHYFKEDVAVPWLVKHLA